MANLQIIVFDVCGTACALHRSAVREFLPMPHLWRPPALPRPVAGFFNLGGHAVPVLRLDVLFGLERMDDGAEANLYRHLILIDRFTGSGTTAFLVDRVLDVVSVAPSQLSPVSQEGTLNGCVEAEVTWDERLVHLLSVERILMAEEQRALAELGQQAQNRLSEWAVEA
ncbi:chemotaxis protein CheW [Microvirga lotononidis]|uniref:Chemotaxis signal transduction protein n=1 Tax=Microvirga lotononidis TaxID=864069 RepID=I4YT28_9HYPH|nr:chemotaxis protein CheW [Microvirga lotononidis]EIM27120.1 chemotaxis signal transduction protein [Microvirga lotononidis]WQO28692.1 chemotaxis protein CheW [Microvirga lotononidis]